MAERRQIRYAPPFFCPSMFFSVSILISALVPQGDEVLDSTEDSRCQLLEAGLEKPGSMVRYERLGQFR